tara:strand:+ start:276 stop:497 length:222 start_codon:yes stop_codon:yes gene_type:complete
MKISTAYPRTNPNPKVYKKFKDCNKQEKDAIAVFDALNKNNYHPLDKTWWRFGPSRKDKTKLSASAYGGALFL